MKFIEVQQGHLSFSTTTLPEISSDECLVKVKAIGVNRADILQRHGKYPAPKGESDILGLEVSGEIVELGEKVDNWQVGQAVFGLVAGGAYAEYVKIKASHMMHLPESMSFEQGAATAETFLTAYQSLFFLGQLQRNQKVLIHAGASGVGTAAIQLAKQLDCDVYTTVGCKAKADACYHLGVDKAIIYKESDFLSILKEEGHTFNVIVDVIASNYVNKNITLSALDAKIIILSMLGGRYAEQVDVARMLLKRVHLIASTLRNQSASYKTQLVTDFIERFGLALTQGAIRPVIDSVFSWQEAEIAHQKMMDNKNVGKLVLKVS